MQVLERILWHPEAQPKLLGNHCFVGKAMGFSTSIWVNYNDLTVLPNPGIMVSVWEIIPKWPNYSG
jgi:hypothetical protein